MTTRAFTVRIPEENAQELEAIAQVDGVSIAEEVRSALVERIATRRKDQEFQTRLRRTMNENRRVLERLAE